MKYVALLRGINVGGNNIIKMADLRAACEACGLSEVKTFIQSGNVIFTTNEQSHSKLQMLIEETLSRTFQYQSRIVLRSQLELQEILDSVPTEWKTREDIRKYIAFVREPVTGPDVVQVAELRADVDSIAATTYAVFMTSVIEHLTKSKFNKLVSKPIFKDITIRNYNTSLKILALMERPSS